MSIKSKIDETKKEILNQKRSKKNVEKVCATRVFLDEFEELERECKELGYKNMSDYFRQIIMDRKKEFSERELLEYKLFLLGKIGNNINQVARILNEDLKRNGEVDYKKTAMNFEKMLEQYYKLIRDKD